MSRWLFHVLLCVGLSVWMASSAFAVVSIGGDTRLVALASGVTTNTTSTAQPLPIGAKSIYGQVVCTSGACAQTQAIYGDIDDDEANGVLLCTLTLTATTADYDACPVITANFAYYYVTTTGTSGTAATGAVYAMY